MATIARARGTTVDAGTAAVSLSSRAASITPYLLAAGFLVLLVAKAISNRLPFGSAGLYSLMVQLISSHGLTVPRWVPDYGPGRMPFAYPPLGLYLTAILERLGISTFDVLRFVPALLVAVSVAPVYLLFRDLTGSRGRGIVATFLALANPGLLIYQAYADGVVRGLAYVTVMAGLWLGYRALRDGDRRFGVLAALAFGLTILTHPNNAVFFVSSLAVFVVCLPLSVRRILAGGGIVAGGVLISGPWWLLVAHRYGLGVVGNAFHTHGGTGIVGIAMQSAFALHGPLGILFAPLVVLDLLANALWPLDQRWLFESVLAFYGFFLNALTRRWLGPVWFVATVLLLPDGTRFWVTVIGFLAANAVFDLADAIGQPLPRVGPLPLAQIALVGGLLVGAGVLCVDWVVTTPAPINRSDVVTGRWLQSHTAPGARVLAATPSIQTAEWYPYLSLRSPVFGPWGAEWTGKYNAEDSLFAAQTSCVDRQSLPCIVRLLASQRQHADYIVIPDERIVPGLVRELTNAAWTRVLQVDETGTWRSPTVR